MTTPYAHAPHLARRLVDYVVLAHDPAVAAATAGYWELSKDSFAAVDAAVRGLLTADPPGAAAYGELIAGLNSVARHDSLADRLTSLLLATPAEQRRLAETVSTANSRIWLDYHIGPGHAPDAPPVGLDDLLALTAAHRAHVDAPRLVVGDTDVHVVIPFRDRTGGLRARNLVACLIALRDQDYAQGRCQVTVVETDTRPRWREVIEPLADSYLFAPHDGLFNKSWTVNVGVVSSPERPEFTCVLDADILVDRSFVNRNVRRFLDGGHTAHVCCESSLSLDAPSTDAAIQLRCRIRAPSVPEDILRGVLLREAPGGALWAATQAYHRIGGFDERFEGWGGEDEDVTRRLGRDGEFRRFADSLLHLDHPRPRMRTAQNQPFNGHVQMMSWTGADGFGDPRKYAPAGGNQGP